MRPASAFRRIREGAVLLVLPVTLYVVAAGLLSMALAWASRSDAQALLSELGTDSRGALVALAAMTTLIGMSGAVISLVLGAVVTHAIGRLLGGTADWRQGLSTYLVAAQVLALRNVLLAALVVSGLLPAENLGALRFGDPFLLLAAVVLYVGVRQVYQLTVSRAAATAAIGACGGAALNALMSLGL